MAKNIKGENLPTGKVAIVTVDDLGKGCKYNEGTKKIDFGGVDTADNKSIAGNKTTGLLEVKLSEQPGNLLQRLPDGLYYGNKASAELESLYVDAELGTDNPVYNENGDPTGAGGKDKPFRTVKHAVAQAKPGTQRFVYLKTGQVHKLDASGASTWVEPGNLYFYGYGEDFDAKVAELGGDSVKARGAFVRERKAPVIEFVGHSSRAYPDTAPITTVFSFSTLFIKTGGAVRFDGLILKNNINAVLRKHNDSPNDQAKIGHGCRILCEAGSVLEFYRCGLDFEGTLTFDGVQELNLKTTIKYNPDPSQGQSYPVWTTGFIQSEGASIKTYQLYNVDANFGCYFLGNWGWAIGLSAETTVSLKYAPGGEENNTKVNYLAHRIFKPEIEEQNGVRIVLAPRVDVSATNFPRR